MHLPFDIRNSAIDLPYHAREELTRYCEANNGRAGEMTLVLGDETPRYFTQVLSGLSSAAIANESFSGDWREKAHTELKRKYVSSKPVADGMKYPKKHRPGQVSSLYVSLLMTEKFLIRLEDTSHLHHLYL
jgi:hypothetical protein